MTRTLVVTNDFPPRHGGIETFVEALCRGLDPARVVVYTSTKPGWQEYDRTLPFPVVRDRAGVLLPTPRVARRAERLFRAYGCDSVLYGASAPLGLLGSRLRRAGAQRQVAITHGHEVWWAKAPVVRQALRRIGDGTDVMTYVSEWCRERIAPALSPSAADRMQRLSPGVDVERFRPGVGEVLVRDRHGIAADAPLVVCVGRLVPRKGQDTLIRAMPQVLADQPDARLLLVGKGPYGDNLQRLAKSTGVQDSVVFTGAVPGDDLPAYYGAGDVFAMPCRARRGGLEVEAWGIVFLEAQACGVPVVVGDSGGAPESVRDGETGVIVDPEDPAATATALVEMLSDDAHRKSMGVAAREWAERWTWASVVGRTGELLERNAS